MLAEASVVEFLLRNLLCGGVTHHTGAGPGLARRQGKLAGLGWHYLRESAVPRQRHEVLVESWVRDALIRLNPEIAAIPERAAEVLLKLYAQQFVAAAGRVLDAYEALSPWLRGERTMPFGPNGEAIPVRLVDVENPENNHYALVDGLRPGGVSRPSLVLLVNGVPIVIVETVERLAGSWKEAAGQLVSYQAAAPADFAPVFLLVAAGPDGFACGAPGSSPDGWRNVKNVESLAEWIAPESLLARIEFGAVIEERAGQRRVLAPHPHQVRAAAAVVAAWRRSDRAGIVTHAQGSGRSLTLAMTARRLVQAAPVGARLLVLARTRRRALELGELLESINVQRLDRCSTVNEVETALAYGHNVVTTLAAASKVDAEVLSVDGWVILADEVEQGFTSAHGYALREVFGAPMFGFTARHPCTLPNEVRYAFGDFIDVWHPTSEAMPPKIVNLGFLPMLGAIEVDDELLGVRASMRPYFSDDVVDSLADDLTEEVPTGLGALFLCADLESCRRTAERLEARGVRARALTGRVPERTRALEDFLDPSSGVRALVCATLPTGADFRRLHTVYLLRTVGRGVALQVVGLLVRPEVAEFERRIVGVGVDVDAILGGFSIG